MTTVTLKKHGMHTPRRAWWAIGVIWAIIFLLALAGNWIGPRHTHLTPDENTRTIRS